MNELIWLGLLLPCTSTQAITRSPGTIVKHEHHVILQDRMSKRRPIAV